MVWQLIYLHGHVFKNILERKKYSTYILTKKNIYNFFYSRNARTNIAIQGKFNEFFIKGQIQGHIGSP